MSISQMFKVTKSKYIAQNLSSSNIKNVGLLCGCFPGGQMELSTNFMYNQSFSNVLHLDAVNRAKEFIRENLKTESFSRFHKPQASPTI